MNRFLATMIIVLATGAVLSPKQSFAQSIGVDADLAVPLEDGYDVGYGFGGRVGFGLPIPAITLQAEAIGDWATMGISDVDGSTSIWRLGAGVRVGLGLPIVPDVFAHLAYASASSTIGSLSADTSGLSWDIGIASTLLGLPLVDLGLHIAYKSFSPSEDNADSFNWLVFGVQGDFGF
ncbi:MAG: hypothetical protein KC561_19425 [Myxococcales bacterium]|nr:hypothetical protein [Myxococcales bacterium]